MTVLIERHLLFVDAYMAGGNATAAALAAGYAAPTARGAGSRLLHRADIHAELERRQALLGSRASMGPLDIIEGLATIARTSITDIAAWGTDGLVFKPSGDLPPEVAASIKEVRETRRTRRGRDGAEDVQVDLRIILHDKLAALGTLARMFGLLPGDGAPISSTVTNLIVNNDYRSVTVEAPFAHITAAEAADAARHMLPLLEAEAAREGDA